MRIVAITQVATLVGFNFSYPFLPLFIQELGVTDRSELALWTGFAIGGSGLAMAFASPIWGLLADRYGRKSMYVRSLGAGTLVLGLQAFVVSVPQLVAVRLANGAFTGSQSAGAMLLASIVPREATGRSLGLMSAAAQVGNLVGPLLGGIFVAAIGLRYSFLVGAGILAVCAIGAALYVQEGRRASIKEVLTRLGAPVGAEGRAFGALATVQNLGWGTGPILGSAFAAVAGIPALYLASAALILLIAALVRGSPRLFVQPRTPAPLTA